MCLHFLSTNVYYVFPRVYIRAEYAALCDADQNTYEEQARQARRNQSRTLLEPAAILDSEVAEPLAILDSDVSDADRAIVASQECSTEKASILGPHWASGGSKTFPQHKAGDQYGIIPIAEDSPFFIGKLQQPIKERVARFGALVDGYARDRCDVPDRVMCRVMNLCNVQLLLSCNAGMNSLDPRSCQFLVRR